jgi:hypothetical protein
VPEFDKFTHLGVRDGPMSLPVSPDVPIYFWCPARHPAIHAPARTRPAPAGSSSKGDLLALRRTMPGLVIPFKAALQPLVETVVTLLRHNPIMHSVHTHITGTADPRTFVSDGALQEGQLATMVRAARERARHWGVAKW